MTHQSPDDPELVSFLKRYRSLPPPASTALEDRIISATQANRVGRVVGPVRWWVASGAVAAGLVAAVSVYRALQPVPPNSADVASLEAFMESSWLNSVPDASPSANDRSAQAFLALVEPLTDN